MNATSKLAARAKEGRYVGHDFMSNGVRVYWPERHSVTVERTVIYLTDDIVAGESPKEDLEKFDLPPVDDDDNDDMPNLIPFDDPINDRSPELMPQSDQGPTETHNDNQTDESPPIPPISELNQLQPQRKKSPSAKVHALTDGTGITGEEFDDADNFLSANIVYVTSQVGNDPANMREALAHPDSQQWMLAMVEEITRLEARNSWEYVYPPIDANLISARFVYNLKGNEHGNPTRYRARLVAQGYKQVEGLDYNFDDIFAPVARLKSVRTMCAIAEIEDDELVQTDIKSAFLYGHMEPGEDVYLVPPKGITLPGLKPGQNPGPPHWTALKHVFAYLHGYCDSDGMSHPDQHPIAAYIFTIGGASRHCMPLHY
ncbi:hypothetical protein EW026_g4270 [Hermanssonia centrifuga]|uniref:Uncharacterized protein n=1 Tax=Hermanssonia centrifuga TaxID=98765 RepID=A0A4S4KHP9_9APHY|nr:hypothetical protein EW026_g4270 [Hermanssonia centrifuga]